ncbi:MAG: glycosyltransferase [Verrucomicrobiota bacterium]
MRIAQVNTTYPAGGSGRIAHLLYEGVKEAGYSSDFVLAYAHEQCDFSIIGRGSRMPVLTEVSKKIGAWFGAAVKSSGLRRYESVRKQVNQITESFNEPVRWLNAQLGHEHYDFNGIWNWINQEQQFPDIVHLHDIHGGYYFDLRSLPALSEKASVFITLHNEWPLTGLCHCTLGCERWRDNCGKCPHLGMYPEVKRDATSYNLNFKKQIYRKSKIYVSAPSKWLMDKTRESVLQHGMVESRVIPNGIDTSIFCKGNKEEARNRLALPPDHFIVLFVGHKTRSSKWKGFTTMEAAYHRFADKTGSNKTSFVLVGEDYDENDISSHNMRYVPLLSDVRKLALYYQAADVLLHASISDNFPTTVLEAMACGLPIVGTRVGGIPEQVKDGYNGILREAKDYEALSEALYEIYTDNNLQKIMSGRSAEIGAGYSFQKMINTYLDWYQAALT